MKEGFMKVAELKSEGLKKTFQVVIGAKDFEKKVDEKIGSIAKSTKVPGFRPGKAPKDMLKQKYRASVMGEALDEIVNKATADIIKNNKLSPAWNPEVKVVTFEDGKDIEIEVGVENLPEIKVKDLGKIELERITAEVPEEEVQKALKYIASSRRETTVVSEKRATKTGDVAVIDFVGSVDGVEFAGGKGNSYPLELGSSSFIPGFEEQLIGKNVGDKIDVKVVFPESYHAKDLAGKDAVFAVEIKELREKKESEINDELAKSLGEESLDKLKETLKDRIKSDYDNASAMKLKRALLDVLDKEYSFELPKSLVDAEYKGIVDSYEQAKKSNQLDENEKNKTEKELLEEYKDIAVRRVRLGLLLSEIGKEGEVKVEPDDLNKAIMKEASRYPGQEKLVFDYYLKNKQAIESLKAPVFEEKIVEYILSKAKVVDKFVSVEELYSFAEEGEGKKKASKETKKKAAKKD